VDEEILKNDVIPQINRNNELERYYGNFVPEMRYTPTDTSELDGILSPVYTFNNNRFYFPVNKRYEGEYDGGTLVTGITMLAMYCDCQSENLI